MNDTRRNIRNAVLTTIIIVGILATFGGTLTEIYLRNQDDAASPLHYLAWLLIVFGALNVIAALIATYATRDQPMTTAHRHDTLDERAARNGIPPWQQQQLDLDEHAARNQRGRATVTPRGKQRNA